MRIERDHDEIRLRSPTDSQVSLVIPMLGVGVKANVHVRESFALTSSSDMVLPAGLNIVGVEAINSAIP